MTETPCCPNSRYFEPGTRIDQPCPDCGHLALLHSMRRGCAGCEAIHAAREARSTTE